jgi:DNA-binding LytR/AlgR family response regulator
MLQREEEEGEKEGDSGFISSSRSIFININFINSLKSVFIDV